MKELYSKLAYNSTNFNFETVESQRLNPRQRLSPIQQLRSFIEIDAYVSLLLDFNNRPIIYVSEGKSNTSFAPLRKLPHLKYRNNWIFEFTHVKFTFEFTRKDIIDTTTKRKKINNVRVTGFPVLIIDIDEFNGDWDMFKRYDLIPNYLIWNPKKPESLQIGYILDKPIYKEVNQDFEDYCRYDNKDNELPLEHQSETYQFHKLFKAFNDLFGGDKHFKLHIAKNPFAATHVGAICWTNTDKYSIDDLVRRYIDIDFDDIKNHIETQTDEHPNYTEQQSKNENIDFNDIKNHIETQTDKHPNYIKDENSRNCQLFDKSRITAYEMADLYDKETSPEFLNYLLNVADSYNAEFDVPLKASEVKATCKSIVKYCLKKKVKYKYPSYQKRRLDKMNEVKNYMIKTYGIAHKYRKADKEDISRKFEVMTRTIEVYASQIRKENPEFKNEKAQTLHKIKALRDAIPPVKWSEIAKMLDMSEDTVKKMYQRHAKKG